MLNYTIDELKQTRFYQEVKEECLEEGREEGRFEMLFMLLSSKFGKLPKRTQSKVRTLSADRLQALSSALLNFKTLKDLDAWFKVEIK
jgi:predicted transposase YdaD